MGSWMSGKARKRYASKGVKEEVVLEKSERDTANGTQAQTQTHTRDWA